MWERAWYGDARWTQLLLPLSWLFRILTALRRRWLCRQQQPWPVPVLVVGNITLGGTGKTPVVLALVELLQQAGWRPAVVSRGYGARPPTKPYIVNACDTAAHAGDEALLIRQRANCPVVIDARRPRAVQWLLDHTDCNVIISDDGLQHYRMWRSMELVVIDGSRGLGNGHCLPAGPLREAPARLQQADALIVNGDDERGLLAGLPADRVHQLQLQPECWINLGDGQRCAPEALPVANYRLQALAGIGNPQRFFGLLRRLGYDVAVTHSFPDHHPFGPQDLQMEQGALLLMTEKDAVKVTAWANEHCWYLRVRAVLPTALQQQILAHCREYDED